MLGRKTSVTDHLSPEYIDHSLPGLSACHLIIYVNSNLSGQIWSRHPAFATNANNQVTELADKK